MKDGVKRLRKIDVDRSRFHAIVELAEHGDAGCPIADLEDFLDPPVSLDVTAAFVHRTQSVFEASPVPGPLARR